MMVQALGFVDAVMKMPSGINVAGIATAAALEMPFGAKRMIAASSSAAIAALKSRIATTERSRFGPTNTDITL